MAPVHGAAEIPFIGKGEDRDQDLIRPSEAV